MIEENKSEKFILIAITPISLNELLCALYGFILCQKEGNNQSK